jgi:hypothetical protein
MIWHWLLGVLGVQTSSSKAYNFWSGVAGDLSGFGIFGAMAMMVRRHNCEVKGCWRLGRHQTAAGHNVCRRHHPDDHLTAEHVHRLHHQALGGDRM